MILLFYEVILNIAVSVFLPIAIVTFTKLAPIDPLIVLYSFFPIVALVIIKFVMDLTMSKKKEGSCTLILCKLIIKLLIYFSVVLGLLKMQGGGVSVSWGTVVIPLWIVTAIIGSFFLIIFIIFFSKLMQSLMSCQFNSSEILTILWLMLNFGSLMTAVVYLELQGAKFGDGKEKIGVFYPIGIVIASLSVFLSLKTILCRAII